MKKKIKVLIFIMLGTIFLIQVILSIMQVLNKNCNDFSLFIRTQYEGAVTKKYADPKENLSDILEIENIQTGSKDTIILDLDKTDFYSNVEIGDTLLKNKGSDKVTILNKNGKFVYELDFGCNK
jgi:uncharacterized protein YxeA